MGDKSAGEGPPPPSPLTGAYLLIVLPQTHQLQHKDNVIHNLTKGLLTWDKTDCHVDLEKELLTITAQAPEGEEAKNGERLIQFASENLVTEVLIHPQLNTLVQCMRNLLSSFTRHRHIIHAGYTCAGNGAWLLQDGTFSYADFAEMYQEHEVQRVLRAYENTVTVDVHCLQEGDWNNLKGKDLFSKNSRVRLNPKDCMTSSPALKAFLEYLTPYVTNGSIEELLESSDVVGNIRFSHPTLYVFPGGQGDAALFGINGFNMLVDGGFARKACFWDFSRHLDRLDAVLMTRLNNGNVQGMTSLLQRKRMEHVYPQIGHFFCNLQDRKHPLSPDGDKDKDPLLVSLFDQGHDILASLRHLQLKPQPCYRDPMLEPVNLYHKVGHGKLDMYVISPAKDSREVREFMAKWTTQDSKIFCSFTKRGGEFQLPLCNKVSICALLVWQPANPEDNITRLLFPGSTPQHKIFEGLDRLKNLEFMKHPVCSARTLSPSSSSVGLNIRTISKPKVPASVDKIIENEDKKIEAVKQPIMKPPSGQVEKPQPKPTPPVSRAPSKQKPAEKPKEKPKTEVEVKSEKPETAKTEKAKPEKIEKIEAVQKMEKPKEKPKRPITKQPERKKPPQPVGGEKKDSLKSSPTTPKKTAENKMIESKVTDTKTEAPPKPEVKSRASSRTKPSPSATPAKSAKEANNRKVLEQKKEAAKRVPLAKKEEAKKPEKPATSRKSVPSPSRAEKQPLSPVKAPRPVTRPKQDAKKIMKTEKDAVTESVVSTPSTVDVELAKAKEDLAEKEIKVEDAKVEETAELPSLSKDEEDEILVVEKIEIEGEDKDKPEESIAVHIRNSQEYIADGEEIKEEAIVDHQSEEKKEVMKTSDITIPDTDSKPVSEDVQDMTKDAPDTSKSRVEFLVTEEASLTKEQATDKLTPKEKDIKEKSTDVGDVKHTDESQPDEKFSTTVESGATTAPTLPEDERIPLDEIKELIEEKHVKEETKEKEVGAAPRPEQPTSLPEVRVIHGTPFDQRVHLLKDIVKTPDEVADLPMHEEADGGIYAVDDQAPLCKELQKSKDDLLNIPAKKPGDKKEDEEVKLAKDENEKEDATKDLKEDDALLDDKVTPTNALAKEEVPDGKETEHVEKETDRKTPEALTKQDSGLEQDIGDEEIKEIEQIDNELAKSSAAPPESQEEAEVLDDDKDKETEKEKLLRKETEKEVEENEEKADKEKPVEKEEEGIVDIKERKEKNEEKEPITKDGSQEDEPERVEAEVHRKSSSDEGKSPQATKESEKIHDASGISEDTKEKDEDVKTAGVKSPEPRADEDKSSEQRKLSEPHSPAPEADTAKSPEPQKLSKSPSPEPKAAIAKSPEPGKPSKSPSPGPTAAISKSPEPGKLSKTPSPIPVDAKNLDHEKLVKSPSPELQIEDVDSKKDDEVPKAQFVSQEKSPEPALETRKSPSPEKEADVVKSPEPSAEISEPKEESVLVDALLKSSKSPSPEPTADASEMKPGSPDTQVKSPEPTAKSPSPQPQKESAKLPSAEEAKSPSPEPQLDLAKSSEPLTKHSKSPSPEPQTDAAKAPSPDEGKSGHKPSSADLEDVEKVTDLQLKESKTPTPEPPSEIAKSAESAAKISKSPSPEPQADTKISEVPVTGQAAEETRAHETTLKLSKSPEPQAPELETSFKHESAQQKGDETSVETSVTKSSQPVTEQAKSPEPFMDQGKSSEPVTDQVKSPSLEEKVSKSADPSNESTKSPEPAARVSKPPSPELKGEESKAAEPIVAMSQEAETKASKSPSPEPAAEGSGSMEAEPMASKSPEPEPAVVVVAKFLEAELETSKSALPEPIDGSKSVEPEEGAFKSSSPDSLPALTKSPEPSAKDAPSPSPGPEGTFSVESQPKATEQESTIEIPTSLEADVKTSKSPSPELTAEVSTPIDAEIKASEALSSVPTTQPAKPLSADIEASKPISLQPISDIAKSVDSEIKAPLPEPTVETAKSSAAVIAGSKSPSLDQKSETAKSLETEIKSSKSPSPEPIAEPAKSLEAVIKASKSPSPELVAETATSVGAETKASKSPSPEPLPETVQSLDTELKTSKSPSPEPRTEKAKPLEDELKASKSPSPEPTIETAKSLDAKIAVSKSPSPEPTADSLSSLASDIKDSKPPSSEPLAETAKTSETETKASTKTPSPDPITETAKTLEADSKASKSPSPEPLAETAIASETEAKAPTKTPSPEPLAETAKTLEADINVSKSPSPEPLAETAVSSETETKAPTKTPSPEPIADIANALKADVKVSKSPSPEPAETAASQVTTKPSPEPPAGVDKSKSPSPLPSEPQKSKSPELAEDTKSPSPETSTKPSELETKAEISASPSPEPMKEDATPNKNGGIFEKGEITDERETPKVDIRKEGKDVSKSTAVEAGPHEPKDDSEKAKMDESSKQEISEESELLGRVQIDHEFDDLPGEMRKDDKVPSLSLREASVEQHSEEGSLPKTAERKQSSGEVSTKSKEAEDKDVLPSSTSPTGSEKSEAPKSGQVSPLPKDSKSPSPEPSAKTEGKSDEKPDLASEKVGSVADGNLKDSKQPCSVESKDLAEIDRAEPTVESGLDASTFPTKEGSETLKKSEVSEINKSESIALPSERKLSEVSLKESMKDEAVLLDKDSPPAKDDEQESLDLSGQELEETGELEVVLGKLVIDKEEVITSVTETSKVASPEPAGVKLSSPEKKQDEEDSNVPDQKSQILDEKQGSVVSEKKDSLTNVEDKSKSPSPEPKIETKDEAKLESKQEGKSEVEVHADEIKVASVLSKSPSPTPSLSEKEGKHPEERETVSPAPSDKSTAGELLLDENDRKSPTCKLDAKEISPSVKKDSLKDGKLSPEISKSPSPTTVQEASIIEVDSKSPEPTTEKQEIVDNKQVSSEVKPDKQGSVETSDAKGPCDTESPFPEKKLDVAGISKPSEPSDESLSQKEKSQIESLPDTRDLGQKLGASDKDKEGAESTCEATLKVKSGSKDEVKAEDVLGSVAAEIQSVIETATESVVLSAEVLKQQTETEKSAISGVSGDDAISKVTLDLHSKSPSPSKDDSQKRASEGSQDKPDISLPPSKDGSSDVSVIKEQVCFATSSTDLKHPLESAEPLDIRDRSIVEVTAKESQEIIPTELTSATITKTEESGKSPEEKPEIGSVADIKDELQTIKDDIKAKQDELSALINGRSVCEHKLEAKILQDDVDSKKSETTVTDILDTAERIVSSLNGKKTIADESDYIPSFSETKSFALTIESKKEPADELTIETKSLEDSSSLQDSGITSDIVDSKAEPVRDETVQDICSGLNGHATSDILSKSNEKEDTEVVHHPSKSESELCEAKPNETSTQSAEEGSSKLGETSPKEDSSLKTAEISSSIEGVGSALSKVISDAAASISDTAVSISDKISAVGSLIPGDIVKSSTSSDKDSITASPDLSRKSDDVSSTKQEPTKGLALKLDSGTLDTSGVLESVVSQGSEKSGDVSGSSSKSCEKLTETTDKKSSLSSTQVEPPTDKDLTILSGIATLKREFSSRSETPASDILSEKDVEIGHITPFSDRSSEQVSRAITHVWETVEGRPESRHYDSDEDIPGSPMSISSHIPSPPQFEYDAGRPQDPMMMSSFYGSLPGDFDDTKPGDLYDYGLHDRGSDGSLKKELGDKLSSIRSSLTSTPESSPLPERRFDPSVTKEPISAPGTSAQAVLPSVSAPMTSAPSSLATAPPIPATAPSLPAVPPTQPPTTSAPPASTLPGALPSSSTPSIPDPIGKWDKPLGLPPPHSTDSSTPYLRWNPYKEWGKPLGLPSPAPPPAREDNDVDVDTSGGSAKTTPKKVARMNAENNKYSSAKETSNKTRRSESPVKKPLGKDRKSGPTPVYMDLSYVPHHGNSNYATVEFFKRVRARYYVFSGTEPSKEVFNALLEAKQSWEDKDLEVTIIPTYDTDTLGYWIAENEETLSKLKIDLSPSASRCTINLQDHDTSCSAYRLEF